MEIMPVLACCKLHAHNYICIPIFLGRRGTPDPTGQLVHILELNLKSSYLIASLLDMYIDMGERLAGKQDRPSLIIEGTPRAPQIANKICTFAFTFWPIYEKLVVNCFPLLYICLHCDKVCIC